MQLQDPASPYHQELIRYDEERRHKLEVEERAKAVGKITSAIEGVQKNMCAIEERTLAAVHALERRIQNADPSDKFSKLDRTIENLEAKLSDLESRIGQQQQQQTQKASKQA